MHCAGRARLPGLIIASLPSQAVAELLVSVPGLAAVETFKNSTTALARMHNWSQLVPALETLGVDVDPDARARIVAGGADPSFTPRHARPWRRIGAGAVGARAGVGVRVR